MGPLIVGCDGIVAETLEWIWPTRSAKTETRVTKTNFGAMNWFVAGKLNVRIYDNALMKWVYQWKAIYWGFAEGLVVLVACIIQFFKRT